MCPLTNEIIIEGCTLRCGCTFSLEALRLYFKQQKQMSKNKREEERELVKCPSCSDQMELMDFRKILVSKDIEIPIELIISAAVKQNVSDMKVNLEVKFADEEIQMLKPFLFNHVKFGLEGGLGIPDQVKETVEGQFWIPLDANFNTSQKKGTLPITLFFKEALDNPTDEEKELDKEFVDPELEEEPPKEEENKQPEEENGEEQPPKELKSVSFSYDLKLKAGRNNKKETVNMSYNFIKRAKRMM